MKFDGTRGEWSVWGDGPEMKVKILCTRGQGPRGHNFTYRRSEVVVPRVQGVVQVAERYGLLVVWHIFAARVGW